MADAQHEARVTTYRAEITADIESCVSQMGFQPILFVGSGLSKRYFSGPSWDELLAILAKQCPLIDKDYAYYKQTLKHPLAIGQEFARLYQQWAWDKDKNRFPRRYVQRYRARTGLYKIRDCGASGVDHTIGAFGHHRQSDESRDRRTS